jgi:hypothetical protein
MSGCRYQAARLRPPLALPGEDSNLGSVLQRHLSCQARRPGMVRVLTLLEPDWTGAKAQQPRLDGVISRAYGRGGRVGAADELRRGRCRRAVMGAARSADASRMMRHVNSERIRNSRAYLQKFTQGPLPNLRFRRLRLRKRTSARARFA